MTIKRPRYYIRCHESRTGREAWTVYDRFEIDEPREFHGFRCRYVAFPERDRLNQMERCFRV